MKPLLITLALLGFTSLSDGLHAQTARNGFAPSASNIEAFQRGTHALQANHPEEAIAEFSQLTHDAPRFAEAFLNLGLALAQEAKNEAAIKVLEQGLALKPSLRGAHLFLAISQYKLSRFEPAAGSIRKETTFYPTDAQAWMWQGIIDLALGRLTTAVDALDRAASIDPRSVDILYHRGHAALALSRQSYEAMFKLDSQSWHVHQVLAEADAESEHDKEAIEEYKLAIASAPPQSGLYEALGSSLWRAGKYDEAQEAYEEALKVDPNDTLAMYKLGCLFVDRSNAAGGKSLLERVQIADPSLQMTTYYLGRAEVQLGNDAAGIQDFKKTIEQNLDGETTKQAYFQLSRAYRRLHNTAASDEAQAQYRLLDQQGKSAMQEKLNQRRLRADRDTNIPAPATAPDTLP